MPTVTYRTAFIGCGKRAHEHAVGVKADDRCQVVALADISSESAGALKEAFGFDGAAVYSDYAEMLNEVKPEVVVLCLWTPLHLPVFRACVEAGVKAVLSEKPMAAEWGECLEMARLAEEAGCQLTFSLQRRFCTGNQTVRRMIREGKLGQLQRMDLYSPPNLLDCGIHTFDQAMSFMAETPAKWVLGAVDASETYNWFNVPSESVAAGLIVFENGVRANIQAGGPDMDIWGGVRVLGSGGYLEVMWDGELRGGAIYAEPDWRPEVEVTTGPEQMTGMVRHALDCLASGEEPEMSHQKALRASEIIFAFYESVRRNARVSLPVSGFTDSPFITMLQNGEFKAADSAEKS